MNDYVLLVGSGFMAKQYLLVLKSMKKKVVVVGRGKDKIDLLKNKFPEYTFHSGGIENFLKEQESVPRFAVNASSVSQLSITTKQLLFAGVKSILLEKPGGLSINGLKEIEDLARENDAQVFIAYNRRFYSSVQKLKEELFIDGGIQSVHFEFTEWLNTIDPLLHDSEVLNKWIIANSSHVIDTVFSLIGVPKELTSFVGGINKISWHSSGSIFVGSGLSENNIPFTYHSNWDGPGRWGIEIITHHRRFYLKPMEILQQQLKNTIQTSELEFDNQIDHDFKAGLYKQTLAFLDLESDNMLNLSDQIRNFAFYYKIGGYSE